MLSHTLPSRSAGPEAWWARLALDLPAFSFLASSRSPLSPLGHLAAPFPSVHLLECSLRTATLGSLKREFQVEPLPTSASTLNLATEEFDLTRIRSDSEFLRQGGSLRELYDKYISESHPSKLYTPRFEPHFSEFPDREALFRLGSTGAEKALSPSFVPNRGLNTTLRAKYKRLSKAIDHTLAVQQKQGWHIVLEKDAIQGHPDLHVNPLHWVPKRVIAPKDRLGRVIVDTSSVPSDGTPSLNDSTDWSFYAAALPEHNLPGLGHICDLAVRHRRANPGTRIRASSVDVASAFQLVITSFALALVLASETADFFLIPLCLVFGWSKSPQYYNVVSRAVSWFHNKGLLVEESATYVDDGTIIAPEPMILESTERYTFGVRLLCGPKSVRADKCETNVGALETLGWLLDLDSWCVSPTQRSMRKLCFLLFVQFPPGRSNAPQHELLSLAGYLAWYAVILPHTRPFLGQVFKCAHSVNSPYQVARLSTSAISDLHWWRLLILSGLDDTRLLTVPIDWAANLPPLSSDYEVLTDASSKIGAGLWFKDLGVKVGWPWSPSELHWITESSVHINVLEFMATVVALAAFGPILSGSTVRVRSDNTAAVAWLRSRRTRDRRAEFMLRLFSMITFSFHIRVVSLHIPGSENVHADALSRDAS